MVPLFGSLLLQLLRSSRWQLYMQVLYFSCEKEARDAHMSKRIIFLICACYGGAQTVAAPTTDSTTLGSVTKIGLRDKNPYKKA